MSRPNKVSNTGRGGGGAAAAAYAIDCRFPRVPNHNGVVAFHIMFIITTVTAH